MADIASRSEAGIAVPPTPLRLALVLAATMAISSYAIPALGVLSPFLVDDLELSRAQLGWVISMVALVTGVSAPFAGRLADRFGGRRLVVLLLVITAASAAALAASPTYLWLVALCPLAGFANGANNPATNTIILQGVPAGRRGLVMGIKQSGVQAGIALYGLTLPTLAMVVGWRWALLGVGAASLVALALTVPTIPGTASPGISGSRRVVGLAPGVGWLGVFALLMGTGTAAVTSFLPLFATERLAMSPRAAGTAVTTLAIIGVCARIAIGRVVDGISRYAYPLAAIAAVGAMASAALALATPASVWLMWLGVTLGGLSFAAFNAVTMLAAISVSDEGRAGASSGVIVLGFMIGMTLSPVTFGALADATGGYRSGWLGVHVACLAAVLWMLLWRRAGTDVSTHAAPSGPAVDGGNRPSVPPTRSSTGDRRPRP